MYLLFILLFPLLLGSFLLIARPAKAFSLALGGAIAEFIVALILLCQARTDVSIAQFSQDWIPEAGLKFSLFVDGINGVLVLLSTLLVPFIIGSTANSEKSENPKFLGLVLLMQAAMLGAFLAKDAFLFYFFFEASLLPIYFLINLYGAEGKTAISFKFFVYTLFGSLFLLIGLIYVYLRTPGEIPSADFETLYQTASILSIKEQSLLFLAFFVAFAIKMPMFPFHTWQPDTYTVAPAQGTMLLSGIMLKMGTYGVIRMIIPMFPAGIANYGHIVVILSVVGVIYGSIIAIQQKDMKRLLAYSSFAHVGLMSAGMLTLSPEGIQGALYQMLSHGVNIVGLFFIVELIERRTKTRELAQLGGITQSSYFLTVGLIVLSLGSVALPLTNGFVGEFLLLKSIFDYQMIIGIVAGITIILGAVYTLRMIQKSIFGNASKQTIEFEDLTLSEKLVIIPLCILVVAGGILPSVILNYSQPAVDLLSKWIK